MDAILNHQPRFGGVFCCPKFFDDSTLGTASARESEDGQRARTARGPQGASGPRLAHLILDAANRAPMTVPRAHLILDALDLGRGRN